jgi:hypothetical protein
MLARRRPRAAMPLAIVHFSRRRMPFHIAEFRIPSGPPDIPIRKITCRNAKRMSQLIEFTRLFLVLYLI